MSQGAEAGGARARRRPLRMHGRLVVAFTVVAVAIVGAFALQLTRLAAMERGIAELRDHQEEMQLALEIEEAARDEYDRRVRALAGEPVIVSAEETEERRIALLMKRLAAGVDEPEAQQWVERLKAAVEALEARCRLELAEIMAGRELPPDTEKVRFTLVYAVEDNVDRLFAFLRDRSAVQSAEVEAVRRQTLRLAMAFAAALPLLALGTGLLLSRAVARELDAMAGALEHHQEQLVRSEKLASLGRLAAGVAHEINNPLQVMIGYLTLHRGRVAGELGVHLARVEREAARCKEIVEAMLQLSRPTPTGPPEPVDLRELSQEVVEAVRITMPEAPEVRVDGAGDAVGSPARFRQVIFNLVKNAAEAAGPSGRVQVEVGCDRDTARVVVSDTGPGIPAELRDRVFEPFFTTKTTGTGLGLALARAIAQAHGGDVELEDAAAGARFSLRTPRRMEGAWT